MDLHEEAGKENEQTLANLSPAEEATSKDEIEIHVFVPFLTELGGSVWENLDLGQDSPIQTSRSVNKR